VLQRERERERERERKKKRERNRFDGNLRHSSCILATHCNIPHCNTLQHAAKRYSTLQHIAKHLALIPQTQNRRRRRGRGRRRRW